MPRRAGAGSDAQVGAAAPFALGSAELLPRDSFRLEVLMRAFSAVVLAALVSAAIPAPAQAQVLGTFHWQLNALRQRRRTSPSRRRTISSCSKGSRHSAVITSASRLPGIAVPAGQRHCLLRHDLDYRARPRTAYARVHHCRQQLQRHLVRQRNNNNDSNSCCIHVTAAYLRRRSTERAHQRRPERCRRGISAGARGRD